MYMTKQEITDQVLQRVGNTLRGNVVSDIFNKVDNKVTNKIWHQINQS